MPRWAGFAEAAGGQTDRQADRRTVAPHTVTVLTVETQGLLGNIMAGGLGRGGFGCLSHGRSALRVPACGVSVSGSLQAAGAFCQGWPAWGAFRGGHRCAQAPLLCRRKWGRK